MMTARLRALSLAEAYTAAAPPPPVVASSARGVRARCGGGRRFPRRLISIACVVAAFLGSSASAAASPNTMAPHIVRFVEEASGRFGIPASWIASVVRIESGGRGLAVSPKGAMGLMQIMPRTWATLRHRYGLGADPFDAHDNIAAGAAYLRELFERYGSPGFLEAYNAGPGRYEDHIATARPLPRETIAYVARIAPGLSGDLGQFAGEAQTVARRWTDSPPFSPRIVDVSEPTERSFGDRIQSTESSPSEEHHSALDPRSTGLFAPGLSRMQPR